MKKPFLLVCLCGFMLLGLNFAAVAEENVYIVKSGDNLWTIAQKNNVTVDNLRAWNTLSSDFLQIGDRLIIHPSTSSTPVLAATTPVAPLTDFSQNNMYTVVADDTLWSIAIMFNTTVEELMEDNNLATYALQIGDVLTVPGNNSIPLAASPSRSGVRASTYDEASLILKTAAEHLGTPYKYGGGGPGGFDCSGFVRYVFSQYGYELPRTAASQAGVGTAVEKKDLRPADIVYFRCGRSGIDHSGIYVGDGKFIHSSSPSSGGVIYSSLTEGYYNNSYSGARRVLN